MQAPPFPIPGRFLMFRRPIPEPMRTARVGYMMTPPEPGCNDARNFPRETPRSRAIRLGRLFVDVLPVQKREEFQADQATWKVRASSGGSTSGKSPRSRMLISARPWRPLPVHACRRLAGQRQARARRLHSGEFCLRAPVVRTLRLSPGTIIGRAPSASACAAPRIVDLGTLCSHGRIHALAASPGAGFGARSRLSASGHQATFRRGPLTRDRIISGLPT